MLSPNVRAWTDEEIDEWTDARPVENDRPLQGACATKHVRKVGAKDENQLAED